MDLAEIVDLDDIPSDAFDLDERDLDGSRSPSVNDDYSSWPADSSPAPGLGEFDDEDEDEDVDEDDEDDDSEEDGVEEDGEEEDDEDEDGIDMDEDDEDGEDVDLDHLGMDDVYMDPLGPLDRLDVGDLDAVDWRPHDGIVENLAALLPHWHRPASPSLHARRFLDRATNFFAAFNAPQNRGRHMSASLDDEDDDALFVSQLRNAFPPIDVDALIGPDHARPEHHHHHHHFAAARSRSLRPQNNQDHRAPSFDNAFGRIAAAAGPSRENQQHNHNYNQPAPFEMPRRDPRSRRHRSRARDELIELEVEVQPPARPANRPNRLPPAAAEQEVIDLTGEPDSPGEPAVHAAVPAQAGAQQRHRHRHRSNNRGTPAPARAGGAAIPGNQAAVIDLTLDDDDAADPPPRPQQLPRRTHPENNNNAANNRHLRRGNQRLPTPFAHRPPRVINLEDEASFDANINTIVRNLGHIHQRIQQRFNLDPPLHNNHPHRHHHHHHHHALNDPAIQLLGAHLANMADPIRDNPPAFNYAGGGAAAGAGAAGGPPKHVPPPPARPGFTRDTRGSSVDKKNGEESDSDDDVIICPGCEQELAYDPNEGKDKQPPAKKARTRKDREEHHFWALKACGHVYCKECYNSRGGGKNVNPAAKFRRDTQKRKVYCAVEDCTTDVKSKSGWVGLFV